MPSIARLCRLTVAHVLAFAVLSSAAHAQLFVQADNNPDLASGFTLNFPGQPASSSEITQTDYVLQLDPTEGSAQFVYYYQRVESLTLFDADGNPVETGELTIVIADSQPGSYNPATGEFTTEDTYEIYFSGDLSSFGIQSPFVLPSASTGTLVDNGDGTGSISQLWDGSGVLDPSNPDQTTFTYQCEVNTVTEQRENFQLAVGNPPSDDGDSDGGDSGEQPGDGEPAPVNNNNTAGMGCAIGMCGVGGGLSLLPLMLGFFALRRRS